MFLVWCHPLSRGPTLGTFYYKSRHGFFWWGGERRFEEEEEEEEIEDWA
jgi:hypothetical protein